MEVEEVNRQQKALDLYEKGTEKESTGLMRDAIYYYSSAIKIHNDVEKLYRQKIQKEYQERLKSRQDAIDLIAKKVGDLGIDDAGDDEEGQQEEELEPCWLLDMLPDDILVLIITRLISMDARSHVALSTTCHRLSHLCFDSMVYRKLCKQIYPYQNYSPTAIELNDIRKDQEEMVKNWDHNWESMLNDRPFLKYHGVYISKVSYISDGARSFSYYAPVKVVTYFRYLRFFPNGECMKLTTTDEPSLVVPFFHRENFDKWEMALLGRFVIELDGQVLIIRKTTDYDFIEELEITNLGDRKFHRLNWISSGFMNKEGERSYFNMKKEKPFNFSGVKSYHVDYGDDLNN